MHNKFAGKERGRGSKANKDTHSFFFWIVVDSKTLINGSFNWSKGARTKNRENIMITNLPYCIQEFQAQFDALWEEF